MNESFDVGVLVHFPDDIGEATKLYLLDLADKWDGFAQAAWPFTVALTPTGDYLAFVFTGPDNANLFIAHAEKYLQNAENSEDVGQDYTIVLCWTGLAGSA